MFSVALHLEIYRYTMLTSCIVMYLPSRQCGGREADCPLAEHRSLHCSLLFAFSFLVALPFDQLSVFPFPFPLFYAPTLEFLRCSMLVPFCHIDPRPENKCSGCCLRALSTHYCVPSPFHPAVLSKLMANQQTVVFGSKGV